jgi:DNA mismatch repair protein MutS
MDTTITPMMAQYTRIKQLHRDAILFFRLGDFYEMFRDDAKEASGILGLTLTRRHGVPMCGIPYHASHTYIEKLLRAGKKIAVCEQIRLPKDGKGIADRDVVEIITPGTVVDEDFLDRSSNNYLSSLASEKGGLSFGVVDISTGEFLVTWIPPDRKIDGLKKEMVRLYPRELLVQESLLNEEEEIKKVITNRKDLVINALPDWSFDRQSAFTRLKGLFRVSNLKGFGFDENDPELTAAGVLIEYLEQNAKSILSHIGNIKKYSDRDFLALDDSTLRNLELVQNLQDGGKKYTLLSVLDHTKTAMGSRLMRKWILEPLVSVKDILFRQRTAGALYHDQSTLNLLRLHLTGVFDLERLTARAALDKAHAKDLLAIGNTLTEGEKITRLLQRVSFLSDIQIPETMPALEELKDLLEKSIDESPSILITEGHLIRPGYSGELDELKKLQGNRKEVLDKYLDDERASSGISNLKIRYNKIIGYFIEVTKSQTGLVPSHFIRRQSLVNGERYTTERLIELETHLNTAVDTIIELEKKLFLEIRDKVKLKVRELLEFSRFLSLADALQSLAQAATIHGFTPPVVNDGPGIRITEGRHPVVEMHLPPGEFVPNTLEFTDRENSFILLTGPNMAGKSTFLRQNALITIMAQIGSFIPASEAEIGIVDKIFCRVGAQDNLARGESTFLVEMNETANILRGATEKSLIIMDEVGRGTGTQDGLAIAWAVCEYIMSAICAKTLFATHYHELTTLQNRRLRNFSMDIREEQGEIVFLKHVKKGPAENSYGIHVAKLAGLPREVLHRAREIFDHLVSLKGKPEKWDPPRKPQVKQPDLFSASEILEKEIQAFPIETSTPLEAMNFLAKLKKSLPIRK